MPLYRMTYLSRAPETRGALRDQFVAGIVKEATRRNEDHGVTGFLVFVDDFFIQVIEGSRGVLSQLMNNIMDDERHRDVQIIHANPVSRRMFPREMSCFNVTSRMTPLLLRYAMSAGFDPYALSPESLDDLVDELIRIAEKKANAERKTAA